ncbi:transcription intermediary factor 1-alpha-like [Mercenaria mercenaria]|uniref:transcription intermediary factor 1-alpha-like n=1 Tax=Mercenaria mercenaria TaxID=6596 RepID=UPI00234E4DD4|nr:transcription intermediary factor 1-alpha-like [Mercenaria mercenaria]
MSMEVAGRMFCKPCGDDTKRVPANGLCRECEEHMCIACFGNHKKYKICKDHRWVDIDTNVPDISETIEEKFENCLKHKNEKTKFYCSNNEEVGCGDCTILEHNTCKVEYISDISKTFKNSKELNDFVKNVDSCQKEVTKFYTSLTDNKVQVEDIYQGFLADIKSYRDEINIRLDKLEERLVQKAKDAKTTDRLFIDSLETSCEDLKKELSQISDELVSRTDEPNTLFVTAMRCKRVLKGIKHKLCSAIPNNIVSNYRFKRNNKIEELLEQAELGTIVSMHEENTPEPDSLDYEDPISLHVELRTSNRTIYEDNISIPDSQEYKEVFEDIPVRESPHKRRSKSRTSWSLFV